VQRLQLTRLFGSWTTLWLLAGQAWTAPPETKSFSSPDGGYTVNYPSTWVHYPKATSLYIVNFPLRQMVREVLLPEHGAMITFASMYPKANSLEEWIANDAKMRIFLGRKDHILIPRDDQSSPLFITEVVEESLRGSQAFEAVNWYFSIDKHLFDAVLLYRKGDVRSVEYRRVLRQVVSSLRLGS
jgi:hypothetical protein